MSTAWEPSDEAVSEALGVDVGRAPDCSVRDCYPEADSMCVACVRFTKEAEIKAAYAVDRARLLREAVERMGEDDCGLLAYSQYMSPYDEWRNDLADALIKGK